MWGEVSIINHRIKIKYKKLTNILETLLHSQLSGSGVEGTCVTSSCDGSLDELSVPVFE